MKRHGPFSETELEQPVWISKSDRPQGKDASA